MSDLEKQVIEQIRQSIGEAIKARLSQGYGDSPVNKLIDKAMLTHAPELEALISGACVTAFNDADFREEINAAFTHKLARVLVSKFEGEVEKRANEIRSSPTMRAKITLAIERAISLEGGKDE